VRIGKNNVHFQFDSGKWADQISKLQLANY
jgi:hypothetical protein